ncbi:MAG: methyltransferase [Candidatus Pacearchaeota archaeon]|nr:methyltransferase [Candidatus Pacearchaeota archaeon]
MPEIYEPQEDSYLMSDFLKKEIPKLLKINPELKLLEVGVGSGINLLTVKSVGVKKKNILGTDVNKEAVKHCLNLGFNCITSDLFNKIKGKFDIIIFNPPYLPLDKKEPKTSRVATTGGKRGNELIIKFLKQAKKYLNSDGKVFIITSSLSSAVNFYKLSYKSKEVAKKNLFFEELSLWELSKIS